MVWECWAEGVVVSDGGDVQTVWIAAQPALVGHAWECWAVGAVMNRDGAGRSAWVVAQPGILSPHHRHPDTPDTLRSPD